MGFAWSSGRCADERAAGRAESLNAEFTLFTAAELPDAAGQG
jgi:hypothetical protein